MTLNERSYRFEQAAHWQAGARRNLELRGDRLVVPDELAIEPIDGADSRDGGGLATVDACGHLMWLRPASRQLVRRPPAGRRGLIELGTLDGPTAARRILAGRTLTWVVADERLDRYNAATLQQLSPVAAAEGWRASDAAGDGGDGLWLTEVDPSGRWRLRHVDCWGRSCRPSIEVGGASGDELSVSSTVDGGLLVVLDPLKADTAYVVDAATGKCSRISLDAVPSGCRTLLTVAPGDRIHLLIVPAEVGAEAGVRAEYRALNLVDGDVEDLQNLKVPLSLGLPKSIVGGKAGLVVGCAHGMAEIIHRKALTGERLSTFITPALVSPLGSPSGWDRAEIDVVLPPGTAMDVTWAATDAAWLIGQAGDLFAGPATAGLATELDKMLPWRVDEMVTYRATGGEIGVEKLAALLDGVEETTLWLRIRLHTPPSRTSPSLDGLRVRYPNTSYLDHLPAIYREDATAARELRRILGPFELLFDQLDEVLAALPDRIDPAIAGDGWTDFLLGWMGFPPLGDLAAGIRRSLLTQAAPILELRGTREGLELLLDTVTGQRASVTDTADEPVGWFLGSGDSTSAGGSPARLGIDALALAQRPAPSRPGTMVVGRTPLGQGCPDPGRTLAQRATTITVTLGLDREQQAELEPIIDRLLPVFVPAHCRVNLVYTGADSAHRTRQLDVDFRLGPKDSSPENTAGQRPYDALLHSDAHWRLGATTRLREWSLPEPNIRPAVLDHGAHLGTGQRLH